MEEELVICSSSSTEGGIGCWDINTGTDNLRYRTCSSSKNGLVCVAGRFLASSQIKDTKSLSGSVFYWSWNKRLCRERVQKGLLRNGMLMEYPQVEVKSFPAEPINPLTANADGTYIVGGGVSGDIYFWEVGTGRLLKKWHAHYRAVTCLVFSDDQSLLISGAEDGSVRVWSLFLLFDEIRSAQSKHLFEHSFAEHTLRVTSLVMGYGGCNAIIASASEDRTCKVWSLSKGVLLRSITFPSVIDAVALDPGEHVFYAGGRDGKIYVAALNAETNPNSSYGMHIIGSLPDHSKAVTCLAFSLNGVLLLAGYEDGMVRVWDTKTRNIVRILRHAKGPVNNILVVRPPICLNPQMFHNSQSASVKKPLLPPPLEKYSTSSDILEVKVFLGGEAVDEPLEASYVTLQTMNDQIKELQQQGSSAAAGMDIERLKVDCKKSMQMVQKLRHQYDNLHQFCVTELVDADPSLNGNSN